MIYRCKYNKYIHRCLFSNILLTAGSEGDIAGSSSEGDEQHRILALEAGGSCSPFGRRQFPRDSGCYDAALKSSRPPRHHQHNQQPSPQGESDASSDNAGFCDNTNNLDSVVEQCNNEILARVRQAQKNSLNLKEELNYQPNIPHSASTEKLQNKKPKDSYVSVHGQITLIDPCRRSLLSRASSGRKTINSEDVCEADQKLTSVKYVVGGGGNNELVLGEHNSTVTLGRSCLSEKSSDSGISSSSLSSANHKETHRTPVLSQNNVTANPAHNIFNLSNCANRTTSTTANNNDKTCNK